MSFSSWFTRKTDAPDASKAPQNISRQQHHDNTVTIPRSDPNSGSPGTWTHLLRTLYDSRNSIPNLVLTSTFALGAASGAGAILAWRRWGMRLRTAEWVTPNELTRRRWVRGVVTSVGDADDFRLYHTPGLGWRWPFKIRRIPTRRKDLKNETVHVRIAGVDAPEGAHYGRPGQPHAEESLAWLRQRILGKTLYCQFIRKDQYGRVVGIPLVPRPFVPSFISRYFGSPLALEMLRAGTAVTYEESGAEYGPWGRDKFLSVEEEARVARRGMWKNGTSIETPKEYKKRYSLALGATVNSKEEAPTESDGEGDQKNRLLSRLSALLK